MRMTSKRALWARPACDPELPERIRSLVTQTQVAGWPRRWWHGRELARHSDYVVLPYNLDPADRRLLARAQNAIDAILGSEVHVAGLLAADEPVLRRHEWEIACAMRRRTEVRALATADSETGTMTAAVVESQHQAMALAEEATSRRVRALERYADQVSAANQAHRDWQSALALARVNDRYLDLVARTAADELAVRELHELADRAAATAQILAESLRQASLTAEVLALPPTRAS